MRDGQAGLVDDLVAVDEEVEVDRARAEPRAFAAHAAEPALDREQPLQELARLQLGVELRDAVEEVRLVQVADRLRLAEARNGHERDAFLVGELLDFRCECGRPECESAVPMTADEYEHVRSDNDRFAVVPGHEKDEIERVVERTDRYLIVDKRPEAEPYVGADGEPDSGA